MISSQKIRELCGDWSKAAMQTGGGISIGGQSEQFRLLRNGLQFHDLCFDQLVASIEGLTQVLLLPGLNTVIDHDHLALWSWCAEMILHRETNFFERDEYQLRKLFEICVRASLANCRKPAQDRAEWEKQTKIEQKMPHHTRFFAQEASPILAYLTFPLLEVVLFVWTGWQLV